MKKTCMNCKHFYPVLLDDKSSFHIHNWCEEWEKIINGYAYTDRVEHKCPYYSDLETGIAVCYLFEEASEPLFPDEWFDKNKAENESKEIR